MDEQSAIQYRPRRRPFITSIIATLHFASACLFIIACVTAPVYHQIGLAKLDLVTYGVFGYCDFSDCSKTTAIVRGISAVQNDYNQSHNWHTKSSKSRDILGELLITTPIAAGLNFLTYLFISILSFFPFTLFSMVIIFFFNVISFLLSAFSCIVVFLLFYPHVTWCAWILIPAAVFPLICFPLMFFTYTKPARISTLPIESDDEDNDFTPKNPTVKTQIDYVHDGDFDNNSLTSKEKRLGYGYEITKLDSEYVNELYNNSTKSSFYEDEANEKFNNSNVTSKEDFVKTAATFSVIDDLNNKNKGNPQLDELRRFSIPSLVDSQIRNSNEKRRLSRQSSNMNDILGEVKKMEVVVDADEEEILPSNNQHNPSASSGLLESMVMKSVSGKNLLNHDDHANKFEAVSDSNSDFTSVSQREVNPNYYGPPQQPVPNHQQGNMNNNNNISHPQQYQNMVYSNNHNNRQGYAKNQQRFRPNNMPNNFNNNRNMHQQAPHPQYQQYNPMYNRQPQGRPGYQNRPNFNYRSQNNNQYPQNYNQRSMNQNLNPMPFGNVPPQFHKKPGNRRGNMPAPSSMNGNLFI
ncbi:hypothetical protein TBLA_0D04990 [Henningerozyma blattae CBS 6284]|uniref:PH-response regulator protein palI/RIM9 n=1 Tax=Henningerozyma blattae (strain ATCC 34711 / CBS 6284 / DSM 70876 / NBRC 10599 / NRRL Y-10934 / UCD 77-7) TaxID=1071380 RepID=I2H3P1_HENB6|nr:hypothetical protein TBLA_0D04990 [Tetrapisispora blattae CBS 6284]CCH60993.1 hypothetical protein TBLA_0D04990 [Tetrapisispora blattae CBS 6284]